jgi:FtsP/CotA-like multicopper oxidase with cupredoxin domain
VGFEVLSINGKVPATRTIEDTLNLNIYDVGRFLVTNDNPGEWMVHCHILGHAHNGMMTVIQFE